MTGRTRDGTWELGVRRTTPLTPDAVWQMLVDTPGALLGVPLVLEEGAEGTTDGVTWSNLYKWDSSDLQFYLR